MSDKTYKVVGDVGDYQILECFGDYRLSKKRYKTIEKAIERIEQMGGVYVNNR